MLHRSPGCRVFALNNETKHTGKRLAYAKKVGQRLRIGKEEGMEGMVK